MLLLYQDLFPGLEMKSVKMNVGIVDHFNGVSALGRMGRTAPKKDYKY